ncbi:hypothetical protein SDC9_144649 [bioreactor metagenome]|uniref:Uncharacterized protein n=1 Tax=bioreactor metagenome TaxID=1076179 RepID=A0A645E7B8_9ZZZZ
MVGRLIQNQEVYWFQQKLYHCQPTSLSSRQNFDFFVRIIFSKHECSKNIPDLGPDLPYCDVVYCLENRKILVQHGSLILSEISNFNIVSQGNLAIIGYLTHYTFHHCGFTLSVFADECHFVPFVYCKCGIRKNRFLIVGFACTLCNNWKVARSG